MAIENINVVQWNISYMSDIDRIKNFLNDYVVPGPVVMCLQEVTQRSYDSLVEHLQPSSSTLSLGYRKPGNNEGANRRLGVAIFSFGITITDSGLLDRTVFPDRTLWVKLNGGAGSIKIISFHSLTGVGYKKSKASNFATIADYLQNDSSIDFMCFDANEPDVDSLIIDEVKFWERNGDKGRNASLIMGPNKVHSLEDSYRKYMALHQQPKSSTMPITHFTGSKGRRYDYIFSSKDWVVRSIEHPIDKSIQASSDHSAVVACFCRATS